MREALSLRSGNLIEAAKATPSSYRNFLPICPQCGEPVHLRQREVPYFTPYFAHHKALEAKKLVSQCPLRIAGSDWAIASTVIPGIKHGQLVDRFQRECCKEIHALFGTHADTLINFIDASHFEPLDERDLKSFIDEVFEFAQPTKLMEALGLRVQPSPEALGVDDVWLFLQSSYGAAVANFIFQTAYFVAVILHVNAFDKSLGWHVHKVGGRRGIYPYDPTRLTKWSTFARETLSAGDKRNKSIPGIASTLVTLVLMGWRELGGRIELLIATADLGNVRGPDKPPAPVLPKTPVKPLPRTPDPNPSTPPPRPRAPGIHWPDRFEAPPTPPDFEEHPQVRASQVTSKREAAVWTTGSGPDLLGMHSSRALNRQEAELIERGFPISIRPYAARVTWMFISKSGALVDLVDRLVFPREQVSEFDRGVRVTVGGKSVTVSSKHILFC
jgi:hypothetical protein